MNERYDLTLSQKRFMYISQGRQKLRGVWVFGLLGLGAGLGRFWLVCWLDGGNGFFLPIHKHENIILTYIHIHTLRCAWTSFWTFFWYFRRQARMV